MGKVKASKRMVAADALPERLLDVHEAADLPPVEAVDALPPTALPGLIAQRAALQARAAARLQGLTQARECEDFECFDAEEVACRLRCSVDLVRERGDAWGIAKVLARDSRGRPSRVV